MNSRGILHVRIALLLRATLSFSLVLLSMCIGEVFAVAQGGPGRIVASTGNELIVFNTNGTNVLNLTENKAEHQAPYPPSLVGADGFYPSASLDGGKVAFQLARNSNDGTHHTGSRIHVMGPDGKIVQLTTSDGLHIDMTSGMYPDDRNPVISPDGSKLCFIGGRNEVEVSPGVFSHPYRDVYVVNADGTNLHQVTQSQYKAGSGVNYSWALSCVWKPDGSEIAFKGVRLHTDQDGQERFHMVLGIVHPDGTAETHIPVLNDINWLDASGGGALDWSPDGRFILVEYGGYVIVNMVAAGYTQLNSTQLGPSFGGSEGSVRFSPDSQRLIYLSDNANHTVAYPTFIDVDGSNRTVITNVQLPRYYPLWWMPGSALPVPSQLALTPNPVRIYQGGTAVQVTPTVRDATGHVIVHAARNWKIDPYYGGSPAVGNFGEVVVRDATPVGVFTLTAANAGLTTTTQVQVCAPITLSATVFSPGLVGVPYPMTAITQVGAVGVTTFAVTIGSLPNGLALSSAGAVSGTPTLAGLFAFTVTATAADGCAGARAYTLSVLPVEPPTITVQPINRTVTLRQRPSFLVVATGTPTPAYRWQVSADAGVSWVNLTDTPPYVGTTTPLLTLTEVSALVNGLQYRCVLTNIGGAAISIAAILRVVVRAVPNDFDGDGRADVTIFRPSTGEWFVRQSSTLTPLTLVWGGGADKPVAGDYDGDGIADVAIFRPSTGEWFIRKSSSFTLQTVVWGGGTDIPVQADYDGDGRTDVAIFRPSTGEWFIRQSNTFTLQTVVWGGGSDIPVQADYDGDGKADVAIFRPPTGEWFVRQSSTFTLVTLVWGGGSDKPVVGDYDGDGRADVAVSRPATGEWFVRQSSTFTLQTVVWGGGSDVPVPGDYDGDGKLDVAIFRLATGEWFVRQSSTLTLLTVIWGGGADIPIPRRP